MHQVLVGRAQDGSIMIGDTTGGRVWIDAAAARYVRDELKRILLDEADRSLKELSASDFREPA